MIENVGNIPNAFHLITFSCSLTKPITRPKTAKTKKGVASTNLLRPVKNGTPCRIRTYDHILRRDVLYPAELRARYRERIIRVRNLKSTCFTNILIQMTKKNSKWSQMIKNSTKQTFAYGCSIKILRQCAANKCRQSHLKESHDSSKH